MSSEVFDKLRRSTETSLKIFTKNLKSTILDNEDMRKEIDQRNVEAELKRSSYTEQVKDLNVQYINAKKDLRELEELVYSYTKQINNIKEKLQAESKSKVEAAKEAFQSDDRNLQFKSFKDTTDKLDLKSEINVGDKATKSGNKNRKKNKSIESKLKG